MVSAVIVLLIIAAAFGLYFLYVGSSPRSRPSHHRLRTRSSTSSRSSADADPIGWDTRSSRHRF